MLLNLGEYDRLSMKCEFIKENIHFSPRECSGCILLWDNNGYR